MDVRNEKTYLKNFVPFALAAFLVGIVGGFASVLAPAFVQDIGLAYNNTTWTALSMAIATATFAPVFGKLTDCFGLRRMLFWGIWVYGIGNVLTALSDSLGGMLVARFVVGLGTAIIAPVVLSYIITRFPPEKISQGFSLYMLVSSVAVVFGPTLGSLMILHYGWRVMMWFCTVLCGTTLLLCSITCKEECRPATRLSGFDTLGSVFIFLFFSLMLCIPSFAQNLGIASPLFIAVLILSIPAFFGLYQAEKRAKNPILNGGFMKRKTFILSVIALFLTQGLMQANMTNIIVFVNTTQPQNAQFAGYAISVMYIGMSLGSILIGPMADQREPKYVLTTSLFITALSCALLLFFSLATPLWLLALSLGLLGFGLGGNATIFLKIVLSGLPAETAGAGTGTYGLFRDLAAPFGVAVFVPLFTNGITENPMTAIGAIRVLAIIEIICVIVGILAVLCLPKGEKYEITK